MSAALELAGEGFEVSLFERKNKLGGLTWSFERNGRVFDNGQHVFLRCCRTYLRFLEQITARETVHLQERLDVPVLSPGGKIAHIKRNGLPAPLHLGHSLLGFSHVSLLDRAKIGPAILGLMRLTLEDPTLDSITFGAWLRRHGQSDAVIERLFDLITIATINLSAAEASLALAARVFRTGLLDSNDGGDLGWSKVPLGVLHGDRPLHALVRRGVEISFAHPVSGVSPTGRGWSIALNDRKIEVDALIVALAPGATESMLGQDAVGNLGSLGTSPIVNVHLVLDRKVMDLPFAAAVDSPVQFVFDHTSAAGMTDSEGQALSISLSAADRYLGQRPEALISQFREAIEALFPLARGANLLDAVVSREHGATFRGVPGSAPIRPSAMTASAGCFVAGTYCATGWPATMESAVRSGRSTADAVRRYFEGSDPRLTASSKEAAAR